ncbi:MAG: hypothetical protein RBR32_11525, partial [Bacteroidales bacterium]|nr:hypothetical protein [Bacteroidales bacterium]
DLYTFIFRIRYVEPFGKYMNRSKPYLCNELVVGLKDFEWKPFQRYDSIDYASNEVGVHFFGNTNQKNKSPDLELAENIWNTIEDFGLDPFEIHNTSFNQYDENGMKFLKFGASLRFEDPNLERIIEKITECSSFIGIDSGPFYLAGSILGYDRCIGLKKVWDFERYIPMEIKKVDINNFNPDDLKKYLEEIYG